MSVPGPYTPTSSPYAPGSPTAGSPGMYFFPFPLKPQGIYTPIPLAHQVLTNTHTTGSPSASTSLYPPPLKPRDIYLPIPLVHPVFTPAAGPTPDSKLGIKIGVPIGMAAVVGLVLFVLYLRGPVLRRRRGVDDGELPVGEDPGGEAELEGKSRLPSWARPSPITLSGNTGMIDTSKELVRNQPYSEYASPPLPEHSAPGAVGGAEHSAPKAYLPPAPTFQKSTKRFSELRRRKEISGCAGKRTKRCCGCGWRKIGCGTAKPNC